MQNLTVEPLWRDAAGDLTDTATGRVAYIDYRASTAHDQIILSLCVDAEHGREEPKVLLFGHAEIPLSRALATIAELQRMLAGCSLSRRSPSWCACLAHRARMFFLAAWARAGRGLGRAHRKGDHQNGRHIQARRSGLGREITKMDATFKPGDRVKVIATGAQGTVRGIQPGLVAVKLDKQPELPGAMTVIDLNDTEAPVQSLFSPAALRRIATPSA